MQGRLKKQEKRDKLSIVTFRRRLKREFSGYNAQTFTKDLLAGITVAAVALPLALAFGVSSGADAGAGLITAIIAGLLIGGLSGASYQISGPTGAMSAILLGLSAQYGLQGVFVASCMSGVILIIASILKAGKLVSFIPKSVMTGFTSGIAVIIAGGQIDNFFGTTSEGGNFIEKIASYFTLGFHINFSSLFFGMVVVVIMIIWPKKWQNYLPSSLVGIIVALVLHMILPMEVTEVGAIPTTLFPEVRLTFSQIPWTNISSLLAPAFSIAALGMIESLLCGLSAGNMKHEPIDADQEILAQGIGNMLIPFFGGVPATAAIARTSVAIKSGGQTRMVSIIHSLVLLAAMFLLAPLMSKIPMPALAGVLMVTAWRMNDWKEINHIFAGRLKSSMINFCVTMAGTIIFDLTTAIIMGICASVIIFVVNSSNLHVEVSDIDFDRLGYTADIHRHAVKIVYVSGPLFFASQGVLTKKISKHIECSTAIILSIRGVSSIDESGAGELKEIYEMCQDADTKFVLCGVAQPVQKKIKRYEEKVSDHVAWDAIKAVEYIEKTY